MSKRSVRSFDVFDTLVGRLYKDPKEIFTIVEALYPFPDFKRIRIQAESQSDGTLEDTYNHIIKITNISVDEANKLKNYEISVEFLLDFPIVHNIMQVRDGDILVTDTYYDEKMLRSILNKVGLKKNVEIFASPNGKSKGTIWEEIKKTYDIQIHFGDDNLKDVEIPLSHGIPVRLCDETQFSGLEEVVWKDDFGLANFMRAVRLMNPYPVQSLHYSRWYEQSQFNLPILIQVSRYINNYCQKLGKKKLLFSSRDCCLLKDVFHALFPDYESIYFCASRMLYKKPTKEYLEYVKNLYNESALIVDTFGSGDTCVDFFKEHIGIMPNYLLILSKQGKYQIPFILTGFRDKLERINYDIRGSLIDFNAQGPVWADPEYDLDYIHPNHACVKHALSFFKYYKFGNYNSNLLDGLLSQLEMCFGSTWHAEHQTVHF